MRITFATDTGDSFSVEIDPDMKLQDVKALLEAEVSHQVISREPYLIRYTYSGYKSGVPVSEQVISLEGRELTQSLATMGGLGVSDNAMLLLRRRAVASGGR